MSSLQSPVVHGIHHVRKTYSSDTDDSKLSSNDSSEDSLSYALLHSSLAQDLTDLSPSKRRDEVFPSDLPALCIRSALSHGYELDEVIAVM